MAQDLAGKTDDFLRADAGYWVSMFIAGTLCCDDDTGPRSLDPLTLLIAVIRPGRWPC